MTKERTGERAELFRIVNAEPRVAYKGAPNELPLCVGVCVQLGQET